MATTTPKPMSVDTLRRLMADVGKPAERWQRLYEAEARGRQVGLLMLMAFQKVAKR